MTHFEYAKIEIWMYLQNLEVCLNFHKVSFFDDFHNISAKKIQFSPQVNFLTSRS